MTDCTVRYLANGYDTTIVYRFAEDAAALARLARCAAAAGLVVEVAAPADRSLRDRYADVMRAAGFTLDVDESRAGLSLVWVPEGVVWLAEEEQVPAGDWLIELLA